MPCDELLRCRSLISFNKLFRLWTACKMRSYACPRGNAIRKERNMNAIRRQCVQRSWKRLVFQSQGLLKHMHLSLLPLGNSRQPQSNPVQSPSLIEICYPSILQGCQTVSRIAGFHLFSCMQPNQLPWPLLLMLGLGHVGALASCWLARDGINSIRSWSWYCHLLKYKSFRAIGMTCQDS